MFVLALLADTFQVEPHQFRDELKALRTAINNRYADRILTGTGLCIALHSIVSVGDSMIFPGEGSAHYKVTFNMIVFKPFRGEIITGKVRECTPDGVYVSLGFFEDVIIPHTELQTPSEYQQGLWVWRYSESDEAGDLWVDRGTVFRFRVTEVRFNPPARQKRFKKKVNPNAFGEEPKKDATEEEEAEEREFPRMIVYGTSNEPGLGVTDWWTD